MRTRDVMTKDVIAVEREKPIAEIAPILVENRIHGVPVIDEEKKIVGILTEEGLSS